MPSPEQLIGELIHELVPEARDAVSNIDDTMKALQEALKKYLLPARAKLPSVSIVPNNYPDRGHPQPIRQRLIEAALAHDTHLGYVQNITRSGLFDDPKPFDLQVGKLYDILDGTAEAHLLDFEGPYNKILKTGTGEDPPPDFTKAIATIVAGLEATSSFTDTPRAVWGMLPYREQQWTTAAEWERVLWSMMDVWRHCHFVTVDAYLESSTLYDEWCDSLQMKHDFAQKIRRNALVLTWHRFPKHGPHEEDLSLQPVELVHQQFIKIKEVFGENVNIGWYSWDNGHFGCRELGIEYDAREAILTEQQTPFCDAFIEHFLT